MLLAVSLSHGWGGRHDLPKLLVLPLFVATVAAGRFGTRLAVWKWLHLEAFLLILAALFGTLTREHDHAGFELGVIVYAVAAMAVQTFLGRLHPGDYALTTVMTGNLAQVIIQFAQGRGLARRARTVTATSPAWWGSWRGALPGRS